VAWEPLADGARWELVPGVDHQQSCRDALRVARVWAGRHGYWVEAELPKVGAPFGTPWVIRFVPREGDDGTTTA